MTDFSWRVETHKSTQTGSSGEIKVQIPLKSGLEPISFIGATDRNIGEVKGYLQDQT